jgi:hypothetical protein
MARGWNETDPEKGVPNRHTRAKIRLLLGDHLYGNESAGLLGKILLKVAEKRPEDVLDAVTAELDGD